MTTPPTTVRLSGLLLCALGGLLMGIGALLPWIRTSLEGAPDELAPTYYGVDVADGKVVLALAIVVIIALIATRVTDRTAVVRSAAIVIIVAAFAGVGVTAVALISADARFRDPAVSDVLGQIEDPTEEMRKQVEGLIDVQLAAGPFAAIGGGILAVAGGALTLVWAKDRARDAADGA